MVTGTITNLNDRSDEPGLEVDYSLTGLSKALQQIKTGYY